MVSSAAFVSLAVRMDIDPLAAVALPTVVEVAARKSGMTEPALVRECECNGPLRDYLAQICRETDVKAALA